MKPTERYYDTIADEFGSWMNEFDLECRLSWVAGRLERGSVPGLRALDVGSGLGHFSRLLGDRGWRVVSLDIAPRLLRCSGVRRAVQGSALALPFREATFELVVSSECIEHTPEPLRAVQEMVRVLRPGGRLLLTCPNRRWRWSVRLARMLRLRRFAGLENWPARAAIASCLTRAGARVLTQAGLYLLPFQPRLLHPFLRWSNRRAQWLQGWMINQCWEAERPAAEPAGRDG